MSMCVADAWRVSNGTCAGGAVRGIACWLALAAVSLPPVVLADTFACANSSIRVFADDAQFNDPPIRVLEGEMLVASMGSPSRLFAFDRLAVGTAVPLRAPTDIAAPGQLVYDAASDEIYLVSANTILVKNRSGAPLRTFASGVLESPYGLALRADGEVLVGERKPNLADPDPIYRYLREPFGNVAPAYIQFAMARCRKEFSGALPPRAQPRARVATSGLACSAIASRLLRTERRPCGR